MKEQNLFEVPPGLTLLHLGARGSGREVAITKHILARECGCNSCPICHRIKNGTCLDITFLSGSLSAKEFRDTLAAFSDHMRVDLTHRYLIIKDLDLASRPCLDYTLKIAEEPPPNHQIHLLATSRALLPGAIISRCVSRSYHKDTPLTEADIQQNPKLQALTPSLQLPELKTNHHRAIAVQTGLLENEEIEKSVPPHLLANWLDKTVKKGVDLGFFATDIIDVLLILWLRRKEDTENTLARGQHRSRVLKYTRQFIETRPHHKMVKKPGKDYFTALAALMLSLGIYYTEIGAENERHRVSN